MFILCKLNIVQDLQNLSFDQLILFLCIANKNISWSVPGKGKRGEMVIVKERETRTEQNRTEPRRRRKYHQAEDEEWFLLQVETDGLYIRTLNIFWERFLLGNIFKFCLHEQNTTWRTEGRKDTKYGTKQVCKNIISVIDFSFFSPLSRNLLLSFLFFNPSLPAAICATIQKKEGGREQNTECIEVNQGREIKKKMEKNDEDSRTRDTNDPNDHLTFRELFASSSLSPQVSRTTSRSRHHHSRTWFRSTHSLHLSLSRLLFLLSFFPLPQFTPCLPLPPPPPPPRSEDKRRKTNITTKSANLPLNQRWQ